MLIQLRRFFDKWWHRAVATTDQQVAERRRALGLMIGAPLVAPTIVSNVMDQSKLAKLVVPTWGTNESRYYRGSASLNRVIKEDSISAARIWRDNEWNNAAANNRDTARTNAKLIVCSTNYERVAQLINLDKIKHMSTSTKIRVLEQTIYDLLMEIQALRWKIERLILARWQRPHLAPRLDIQIRDLLYRLWRKNRSPLYLINSIDAVKGFGNTTLEYKSIQPGIVFAPALDYRPNEANPDEWNHEERNLIASWKDASRLHLTFLWRESGAVRRKIGADDDWAESATDAIRPKPVPSPQSAYRTGLYSIWTRL